MPIVPTFQGGVPQVRDNGGSGFVPARAPAVNVDAYGRMMQQAMKPVEEWSNSLTEALRIEHQRTVKAESDDAERQVIDAINARMSGENGYMTQQGKNAMDAFQPTVEGMTADVDKIVGSLQPQVREVIGSRIQDRLSTAVEQARRWNGQQTRAYHLQSSEARVQSLMSDADNHYAETGYLQKTWGSITQEIDYQAAMMGLPAEQVKRLKDQSYDLFTARRFEAWGSDNPVLALQVFKSQRPKVSADIAARIESGLFSKSRDTLALSLAQRPISFDEDGNIKNLSWMDDPGAATGDAFIDSLKNDQRLSVVLRARQLRSQMIQMRGDEFNTQIKNNLAEALLGNNPEKMALDQFTEAYGPKKGLKQFKQYELDYEEAQFKFNARNMSDADIDAYLKAMKPVSGSEDFAARTKLYQTSVKAANEIKKERQADKIGYALKNEYGSFKALDWDNAAQVQNQLTYRANEMTSMKERWGGKTAVLSKDETEALKTKLSGMAPAEQALFLRQKMGGMTEDVQIVLADQIGDNYGQAIRLQADKNTNEYVVTYLQGRQAIAEKNAAVTIVTNDKFAGTSSQWRRLDGLYGGEELREHVMDAVEGVAAGLILSGNASGSSAYDKAFETVVGDIQEYNGRKVALRNGVTMYDLRRTVVAWRDRLKDSEKPFARPKFLGENERPMTGAEFSKYILSAQLLPLGEDNTFSVVYGDQILYDVKGNPIVIEVNPQ
jgi:hypothetical protein|nr:MAG TPA: hypothetical protein [Caudoviricetes sp.]